MFFLHDQVNSEFYMGWFDYWHQHYSYGNTNTILTYLKQLLDLGANVNL